MFLFIEGVLFCYSNGRLIPVNSTGYSCTVGVSCASVHGLNTLRNHKQSKFFLLHDHYVEIRLVEIFIEMVF